MVHLGLLDNAGGHFGHAGPDVFFLSTSIDISCRAKVFGLGRLICTCFSHVLPV